MSDQEMFTSAISDMHKLSNGMDILIISTTNSLELQFWTYRLNALKGQLIKEDAIIIVVYEDWPSGAGNGLGTLYSFKKASVQIKKCYGIDLLEELEKGKSIALYHNAGKGTRLAPLPGSEHNSKSKVKLPSYVFFHGKYVPITLLESVIKQTSIYAPSRKGRLSVFWSDQIFIPSVSYHYTPTSDIDIFVKRMTLPNKEQWEAQNLSQYGMILCSQNTNAIQLEKLSYEAFEKLYQKNFMENHTELGISLGSFSLSHEILKEFLIEFEQEISQKKNKLDTDPHFWMPLTLDEENYCKLAARKSTGKTQILSHYKRMQKFKENLKTSFEALFLPVDIGESGIWYDFGHLKSYYNNIMDLTTPSKESKAMQHFFKTSFQNTLSPTKKLNIDSSSIVYNSSIKQGNIKNSVLIGVNCESIDVENVIIIDTHAVSIKGEGGILYNVADSKPLTIKQNIVRADVYLPNGLEHVKLYQDKQNVTSLSWSNLQSNNLHSFEEIYNLNSKEDFSLSKKLSQIAKNKVKQKLNLPQVNT